MKKTIFIISMILSCSSSLFAQEGMIGEVRLFAGNYAPQNWAFCDGTLYNVNQYSALFQYIGSAYGGDGSSNFAVPDLRARVVVGKGKGTGLATDYALGQKGGSAQITYTVDNLPLHSHTVQLVKSVDAGNSDTPVGNVPAFTNSNTYASVSNAVMGENSLSVSVASTGVGNPQNNLQPYLGVNYIICINGIYNYTSDSYIGEIKLTASSSVPNGWLPCDGRVLTIAQNQALYSLLGATFGGNTTTFNLPDLRGRVPLCSNNAVTAYVRGKVGGTETESLTVSQMAMHSHLATAKMAVYSGIGNSNTPENNYPAINPRRGNEFTSTMTIPVAQNTVATDATGGGQPVDNRQPYATLQYIICVSGLYPYRQ